MPSAKTANLLGKRRFYQLAEFERHHYKKLEELAASLQKQGKFIAYEGNLPLLSQSKVPIPEGAAGIPKANKMSMMQVAKMAQGIELQAKHKFTDLAAQTTNLLGRAMFEQLAQEEQVHDCLLTEAYWYLNDRSVWACPKE